MKKKLTHFKCDGCNCIRPLREGKVVKAEYTSFCRDSKDEYVCYHYHIQLCKDCRK